jgi:hypothetical protein
MHGISHKSRTGAIIALLAFYAFFLQTFLAAATTCPTPDLIGVICTSHGPASPSQDVPLQHDHQCCTALHMNNVAPEPPIAFEAAPVDYAVETIVFSVAHLAPKTGPPTASHGARSPPVA